ncbi:MAG: diphthine synthase [Candidatus Marsarchaeota archaeon]|jgi:diphthine synthase|nr:diphthine synthase [Candidatus Marsarchaeota archaeon]
MLFLVGLGLENKDISARALEVLQTCDSILIDTYTAPIFPEYISYIEEKTKRKLITADRHMLEENVKETIKDAKTKDIAILIPGDPLVATTHHIILDSAKSLKIAYHVYHSSSIFSAAIGESRLDIYKFGRITTIPFWSEKYKPVSFIDVIKINLDNDEHTLLLVDVNPKTNSTMDLKTALGLLLKAENERKHKIITESTEIFVLGDIGMKTQLILFSDIESLLKNDYFNGKKISIIIPGKLTFAEDEATRLFRISNT